MIDEQSQSQSSNVNDPNNQNESKSRRKRRSKNEQDGRCFRCSDCGKSYLSQPALTNHKKTKHKYNTEGEKKGRGRPRKNPNVAANENTDKKFRSFFEKDTRKTIEGSSIKPELFIETFIDIFNKYQKEIFFHNGPEQDPFYSYIKNLEKPDEAQQTSDEQISKLNNIDEIFAAYLKEFYTQTNPDYFHFMFKFVMMFRQCINKLKNASTFNPPDPINYYTQHNNAEGVPDMCNDFVTDFMEPNDYFGMDTLELIEIIQHLCHWLFVKNYTTSRLTLV